jgi:hypothetical protein
VNLADATISGNTAPIGGGIYAQNLTATFATITANNGGGVQFGTLSSTPTVSLIACLVQGNSGASDLAAGKSTTIAGNHNLVGSHDTSITLPNDTLGCNPNLAVLADNGGPTPTHALQAGSCAIDAGPPFPPGTIPSDQRGAAFARRVGLATDIGAFEMQSGDRIFYDGFAR